MKTLLKATAIGVTVILVNFIPSRVETPIIICFLGYLVGIISSTSLTAIEFYYKNK